jgi:ribonuclease-3
MTDLSGAQATKLFNPWNAKNRNISLHDCITILKKYGYKGRLKDMSYFQQACIHTSYVDKSEQWAQQEEPMTLAERPPNCLPLKEADNEELEYAGDGLLGGIIACYLRERYSGRGEGFMTTLRTNIVNNQKLGELALKIGLAPFLIISRHVEDVCNGRKNLRLLGSMFEAWLGALYYTEGGGGKGFEAVQNFVITVIEKHIDFVELITNNKNFKDQLLRFFQAKYHQPPKYKEVRVEGPPHDRIFTMGVLDIEGNIIAEATARNKPEAEQAASRIALEKLRQQEKTVGN